jgi:hypothetical protein
MLQRKNWTMIQADPSMDVGRSVIFSENRDHA